MIASLYVVMGTTGEYSDRIEWPVCAYADKTLADTHADLAQRYLHRMMKGVKDANPDMPYWEAAASLRKIGNPFDDDAQIDYTGTDYYVISVPVRESLPVVPR